MKKETIKIKLNKRKIKRNILIIIFTILIIKYVGFMNNYNKKAFAVYDNFVNYAEQNGLTISQENYKAYIKNTNK